MDFKIDKIESTDLDNIYNLGCGVTKFTGDGGKNVFWPKNTLQRLFSSDDCVTLKLVSDNEIVGFCLVMIHPASKKAVIENFFVLNEFESLKNDFYLGMEEEIKKTDAQFIAHLFDEENSSSSIGVFVDNGYISKTSRVWLHKNISFSNPMSKNN